MNSITMHILGAFVEAAMKSTTFGWRSAVITRTYDDQIGETLDW
jgi:hypothetical protein